MKSFMSIIVDLKFVKFFLKKKCLLARNFYKFFLIIIFFYFFTTLKTSFDQANSKRITRNSKLKYVQLLTGRFDWKDWGVPQGLGESTFKNCKEKRCFAFKSSILQTPIEESDGIMVHGPNLWYMPSRKKYKRNKKQLWLYYSMESPRGSMCSMHYNPKDLDDWFNLTVTYKQDSNFVSDYKPFDDWKNIKYLPNYITEFKSKFSKSNISPVNDIIDLTDKNKKSIKKASVMWFVSHCETSSRRENFIKEMLKYINIDIYGNCGSYFENTLPDPCKKNNSNDCFNDLLNSYKFYLSFENSLCDDYITEKYWKLYYSRSIFKVNVVPVVRGAKQAQYDQVTHQNSFINAFNFDSPKQLADYLNYLNSNDTAYLEYFDWKIDLYNDLNKIINSSKKIKQINERSHSEWDRPFCKMCETLWNETYMNSNQNPIWNLSEWFGVKTSCNDMDEERRVVFWFAQLAGFCF